MPETTGAAGSVIERIDLFPGYCLMSGNNHLANSLPIVHGKSLVGMVNENNAYLTPIIGIDSTRGIQNRNTRFEGQAASGANLGLISCRKRNKQAGSN